MWTVSTIAVYLQRNPQSLKRELEGLTPDAEKPRRYLLSRVVQHLADREVAHQRARLARDKADFGRAVTVCRDLLLAIPAAEASTLAQMDGAGAVESHLRKAIGRALHALSEYDIEGPARNHGSIAEPSSDLRIHRKHAADSAVSRSA